VLGLKFIRENTEIVAAALKNRFVDLGLAHLLELDQQKRVIVTEVEQLKQKRNIASQRIAALVRENADIADKTNALKRLSLEIKEQDLRIFKIQEKIHNILIRIPNLPHNSVPVGKDAKANVVVKKWKEPQKVDFIAKDHIRLAEELGIIDFRSAAKISGANFVLFKGAGASLERALINFMLDLHIKKHGYTEVSPPLLVNRQTMFGTGQIPKLEDDMYKLEDDDLFLIPTAEVPVTNIHSNEILSSDDLPICYTAYTPCFRREAGSYGKDTRGLVRVHQFDKVEMVKLVRPENSYMELETILSNAEEILQALNLPYRVLSLSTGEISFAAAKCYDIEVWASGIEKWLEVSSCSNFTDFQARRANIKFKDVPTGKIAYVHTLNGSGLALPRVVVAIIENYQQKDGRIRIPEVLQSYMDGLEFINAN